MQEEQSLAALKEGRNASGARRRLTLAVASVALLLVAVSFWSSPEQDPPTLSSATLQAAPSVAVSGDNLGTLESPSAQDRVIAGSEAAPWRYEDILGGGHLGERVLLVGQVYGTQQINGLRQLQLVVADAATQSVVWVEAGRTGAREVGTSVEVNAIVMADRSYRDVDGAERTMVCIRAERLTDLPQREQPLPQVPGSLQVRGSHTGRRPRPSAQTRSVVRGVRGVPILPP